MKKSPVSPRSPLIHSFQTCPRQIRLLEASDFSTQDTESALDPTDPAVLIL